MGILKDNFRVAVTPNFDRHLRGEKWDREKCDELAKAIKRHVDDVYEVDTIFDKVCEFCGDPWTEKSTTYNGGCCDQDEKNNPENSANEAIAPA